MNGSESQELQETGQDIDGGRQTTADMDMMKRCLKESVLPIDMQVVVDGREGLWKPLRQSVHFFPPGRIRISSCWI